MTKRVKEMGKMGRKGGSMTSTVSYYGFTYTIFDFGTKPHRLIVRA